MSLDTFAHLCDALGLRSTDMVVPLTAYFDASGTQDNHPVWAVGGWIAEVDQWKRFCIAWQQMLDHAPFRAALKPSDRIFHAAELESRQGIYSDWTEEQKRAFQEEAYTIIDDLQLFPISTALIKADYEALKIRFAQFKQGHQGNYYLHSVHDVLKNVKNWLDEQRFEASVQYVLEAGTLGEKQVERLLTEILNGDEERPFYHMRGYAMQRKDTLPLQAADIWAYEAYKHMLNRIIAQPITRDIRYPFRRLYRFRHIKFQTYWDRDNLGELAHVYRDQLGG